MPFAVWHSSIRAKQQDQLEAIQRRAVRTIFGNEPDIEILAMIHDIPLLADRCDRHGTVGHCHACLCASSVPSHCLHSLLLENSVESSIHTLHNHKNYQSPFPRRNRFIICLVKFSVNIWNLHLSYWHFVYTPIGSIY